MTYKNSLLLALIVVSMAGSTVSAMGNKVSGADNPISLPTCNRITSALTPSPSSALCGFLLFSFYCLYSRAPKANFQSRFDAEKLTALDKIATSEYWKNIWYFYYDKIVGQCFKSKSHKLGEGCDEHSLQLHKEDIPQAGLLGNVDLHVVKVGDKVIKNLASLFLLYHLVNKGGIHSPVEHAMNKIFSAPKPDNVVFTV